METIAILGWGSLVWEERPDFDRHLVSWNSGGPVLPIEFSRKSKSRGNALTLVIDRERGSPVETYYAMSKRKDPRDALKDLRSREGTTLGNIGFVDLLDGSERGRDEQSVQDIRAWAMEKKIQFVAWTDLSSHFAGFDTATFTTAATDHLKSLDPIQLRQALMYILMAPKQTDTGLRRALMEDKWFQAKRALYGITQ
jgi:hypothetical protein